MQPEPGHSSAAKRAMLLLVIFATAIAYHNSLIGPFIFDDARSIQTNPTIQRLGSIGNVLSPPGGSLTVSGRPMLNLSLAINYALSGTAVPGYHLFNLAIHMLAALTLFGVVRRTLLQPSLQPRFGSRGKGVRDE